MPLPRFSATALLSDNLLMQVPAAGSVNTKLR